MRSVEERLALAEKTLKNDARNEPQKAWLIERFEKKKEICCDPRRNIKHRADIYQL